MRISTNDTEQWALKQKFDKAFDDLFLKQDFAFHVCSILHRCPNGLDMDTLMEEDSKIFIFNAVAKSTATTSPHLIESSAIITTVMT